MFGGGRATQKQMRHTIRNVIIWFAQAGARFVKTTPDGMQRVFRKGGRQGAEVGDEDCLDHDCYN
jgi:hypothetical protein